MKKSFLTVLTVTMMATFSVSAEIASGTWESVASEEKGGGSGTWSVSDDGVLTVSGTGYIKYHNNISDSPWYQYRRSITAINISEGITDIGEQTFVGLSKATSLSLPETLKTIETRAFANAGSVTSLYIPASVTTIGDSAFRNFYELQTVTFAEDSHLTSFGTNNFDDTKLESIAFPQSLTTVGADMLSGGTTQNVFIPDTMDLDKSFFSSDLSDGHMYCARSREEMCRNFVSGKCGASNKKCIDHYLQDVIKFYDVDKTCDTEGICTYNSYTVNGVTYYSYQEMVAALGFPVPLPKTDEIISGKDDAHGTVTHQGEKTGYKGKRIYTVEEANEAAGKKNKVIMRYR